MTNFAVQKNWVLLVSVLCTGCTRAPTPAPPSPSSASTPETAAVAPSVGPDREAVAAMIRREGLTLSIPGADTSIPDWVGQQDNEPFPVRAFLLSRQPPEDNAEPWYLLGLGHIGSDMNFVFPEAERERQLALTRSLNERYLVWEDDQGSMPLEQRLNLLREILSDAAPGLHVLDEAQRHRACTFITGTQFSSVLPHAQSARVVARLAALEIDLATSTNDFERAIRALERTFRLSRDLRPRGFLIVQYVSIAIDSTLFEQLLKTILPVNLTVSQCDRLLSVLGEHEKRSQDLLTEGFRMEYIMFANSLDGLQTGRLTAKDLDMESLLTGLVNYKSEWKGANELYADLFAYLALPYHEVLKGSDLADMIDKLKADAKAMAKNPAVMLTGFPQPLVGLFMFPAYDQAREAEARHQTRIRGLQALIAVRRYQVQHRKLPGSLREALSDVGRTVLPLDPYSGDPLRYVVLDGVPLVYSVGKDQVDDGGRVDWDYGRQAGDFILRIGKPPLNSQN